MAIDINIGRKKPIPRTQRAALNRARQYKRDTDNVKDVSVSLMDLDSAIMFYFTEVIKPAVIEDGETIKVPVMYSSPERWFAVQKTGFMRDRKRQLILPAIAFRRTGMEKDTTIPVDKIDPEEPKLHWQFERKYTDANRYDNFSVQQGIIPQREYYNVAVPDYMILSYDFMIWTHYIEQMNKIVERINWSAGSYWGEPGKMRFRTNIDSYTDSTDVSERERIVRTEFSVTLNGYLIPEAFNELAGPHLMQKHLTPKTLTIGAETDVSVASIVKQEEGVQQVTISGAGSSAARKTVTDQPIIFYSGTGITLSSDGVAWDGAQQMNQTISIGQAVATTSDVQFNQVTASKLSTVEVVGALSVTGDTVIQGDLTAQSYTSELVSSTVLYDSGSTKFGDTYDDTHQMTGSLNISGSYVLGGYTVNDISNDATFADASQTALVTEYATKTYVDQIGTVSNTDLYLRKQSVKKNSSLIGNSTASFSAVTASSPSALITDTNENDFLFFLNGQYMEHDALTIQQANDVFYLKVDTDSIGYVLESDDEIIAWGRFDVDV